MKLLFVSFILSCSVSFASDALTMQFESYVKQTSKEVEGDVIKDIQAVAAMKLNEDTDFNLIKNVLLTLIKLDQTEPDRTAVMMLGRSYTLHTKLYKKAFAAVKTKENKNAAEEIEQLMISFSSNGNG